MKVIETALEGVVILEPELHRDARGYFFESYSQKLFDRSVRPVRFVQDNESRSSYGVLRGSISSAENMHKGNWCA